MEPKYNDLLNSQGHKCPCLAIGYSMYSMHTEAFIFLPNKRNATAKIFGGLILVLACYTIHNEKQKILL